MSVTGFRYLKVLPASFEKAKYRLPVTRTTLPAVATLGSSGSPFPPPGSGSSVRVKTATGSVRAKGERSEGLGRVRRPEVPRRGRRGLVDLAGRRRPAAAVAGAGRADRQRRRAVALIVLGRAVPRAARRSLEGDLVAAGLGLRPVRGFGCDAGRGDAGAATAARGARAARRARRRRSDRAPR